MLLGAGRPVEEADANTSTAMPSPARRPGAGAGSTT
jgi:hypothetical protein